jgi:hypothetical protein
MKKLMIVLSSLLITSTAAAQVGTTVKESGKAVAETAQQAGNETKGAVSSGTHKAVSKAKAQAHKAKAHHHAHAAKEAAKETAK